jgi:ribosomal protein S18 acetylase RimI-like enzyme
MWQAARSLGAYALVGCSVAPGFDFADFALLTVETRQVPLPTIRELRSAWLRPSEPPEALVYPGDDDPRALHVGAFQEQALLGIASVVPGPRPDGNEPDAWQMRGVAVHPWARGEGIGRTLVARCAEHVRAHRGGLLWCNARVAAVAFYLRLGYERTGEPFEVPGAGTHYVMMRTP